MNISKAILFLVWLSVSVQCSEKQAKEQDPNDLLNDEEKREGKNAFLALTMEDDLEESMFASEPEYLINLK